MDENYKINIIKTLSKITLILVLLVYTLAIISKSAEGYEISIYAMYPSLFWLLIITCVSISVIIIILSEYWNVQGLWKIALISILITYSIILLLPLFRGYYMYSWGDTPAHLSWAQHILNTGTITTDYPIVHIQLVALHFSGISLETAALLVPVINMILYILGLCILGKSLQKGIWLSLLPILFAVPLIRTFVDDGIFPQSSALILVPILFYAIFSSFNQPNKTREFIIVVTIISFCIVFLHPLLTLLLIILLLGFIAATKVITCRGIFFNFRSRIIQCLLLISITFAFWFFIIFGWRLYSLISVIDKIVTQDTGSRSIAQIQMDYIVSADVSIFQFIEVFIRYWGGVFFYFSIGLLCGLIVIYNVMRRQTSKMELLFFVQYITIIIFFIVLIIGNLGLNWLARTIMPVIMIVTIFIPIVVYGLIKKTSSRKIKKYIYIILLVSIVSVSTFSIFTKFESPFNYAKNSQFSYHDKEGLDWFLKYQDEKIPLLHDINYWSHYKYALYFVERSNGNNNHINPQNFKTPINVIDLKTIYDKNISIADTLPTEQYYFQSNEASRQWKRTKPQDLIEYTYNTGFAALIRLKQDSSINLIYANGEFESWII